MADSVIRMKIDSQEYESKLKRAAEQLNSYAEKCRKVCGTLEHVDEGVLEFTRSLGKMETTSSSARGKLAEMTKAFTDLSVQYKNMTEEEKNGAFGKALNDSLTELKGRIQESKGQLDDVTKSLNGDGGLTGALDAVAGKFGLSIDQLTKFGSVLGVATGALKTVRDAFFQNETNVDDWGRTVAAAEGVYDSFLQTLNNGDFSGFLSRISEVITKAKDAYNALDELQTRMTIINPERTKLQSRATELKAVIRRQGADSEAGQAAQVELRELEGKLSKAFKTESELNYNAFKALVDARLKNAGITLDKKSYDFLMRTFSSDDYYMAMRRGAKGSNGREFIAGGSYDEGSTYKSDTRNINQKLLDLFTDEWRKENSSLLNAAFGARGAAASAMLSDARYLKEGKGGKGGSGGGTTTKVEQTEMQTLQKQIQELEQEYIKLGGITTDAANIRKSEIRSEIQSNEQRINQIKLLQEQSKGKLLGGEIQIHNFNGGFASGIPDIGKGLENLPEHLSPLQQMNSELARMKELLELAPNTDAYKEALQKIVDKEKEIAIFKGGTDTSDTAKETAKSWQQAASAMTSVSGALNQIEDPAAKIAGVIGMAIANIASGFAAASAGEGKSGNVWYWIAATAAGLATMVTTIASIRSATTGYAEGGMIKGNSYSGDNIGGLVDGSQLVGLNAGEIVLNHAQQANLASSLQGNGLGNLQIVGVLEGEKIKLVLNRHLKRTGQGEIVTW